VLLLLPSGRLPRTGDEGILLAHAKHLAGAFSDVGGAGGAVAADDGAVEVIAAVRAGDVGVALRAAGVPVTPMPSAVPRTRGDARLLTDLAADIDRVKDRRGFIDPALPITRQVLSRVEQAMRLDVSIEPTRARWAHTSAEAEGHPWHMLPKGQPPPTETALVLARALAIRQFVISRNVDVIVAADDHDVTAAAFAVTDLSTRLVWYVQQVSALRFEAEAAGRADAIVAVADHVAKRFCDYGNIEVVRNGARPVDPGQPSPLPADDMVVGVMGLDDEGADVAIDAFGVLMRRRSSSPPQTAPTLWLIGGATPRRRLGLFRRALQAGVAHRVRHLGHRDAAAAVWGHVDVAVFCSGAAGHDVALVEAMAAGCACVGADVDGVRDVLGDGVGAVVAVGDAAAVADAIAGFIDHAGARAAAGENARARVDAHHHWSQMLLGLQKVVSAQLGARRLERL
jgi:glycosyltransferase involved in cell wall biosynthesis